MKPRRVICHIVTAVGVACLCVSCDRLGDPGIKEKVALLEAELRDRDAQLTLMQEETASKPAAEPANAGPDLQAASGAYLGFVDELRKQLAAALPGAKFERTSVFPVVGPDPLKPITSSVAFRVVRQDGKSGEISVPLFADAAGKWLEPEADQISEITAKFKAKPANTPAAATSNPAAQPAAGTAKPKPTDVMGANRTVEVDWGDAPPLPQGTTAAPAPKPETPPAAPPAPVVPKKVMPTSRDVIIDFD
jgi:hypothetical protein